MRDARKARGQTLARMRDIAQRTVAGLEQASAEMAAFARARPAFKAVCTGMGEQWGAGIRLMSYFDAPLENR